VRDAKYSTWGKALYRARSVLFGFGDVRRLVRGLGMGLADVVVGI
jgi:hypothetical protein